jgi:hypothetical protein
MRVTSLIVFSCFACSNAVAQDTIPRFSLDDFKWSLRGGLIYQGDPFGTALLPNFIAQERGLFSDNYSVGDEPLIHGASYLDFGSQFHYSGFSLATQLVAEHRGQSYGVYDLEAIDVYPKYLADLDTGIHVLGHRIGFDISAGNYDDMRLQQGLTMYNLDAQGSRWSISFDRFSFTYQKIADLQEWIGLNQNDGNVTSFKVDSLLLPLGFSVTGEYALSVPTGVLPTYSPDLGHDFTDEENTSFSYSIRLMHSSGIGSYGEFGVRNTNIPNNAAYLLGICYSTANKWFTLNCHSEYRNYGSNFNLGFYQKPSSYIDPSGTVYSTNVINYELGSNYLYPIQLYDRPFSQWAVFTEYQGLNVSGLTFYADVKVPIWSGIFFKGLIDWNRISAEGQASFVYPFYNLSLGWQPFEGVFAMYGYTNRTMNLDAPYPTLYLYESPTTEMRVMWQLKF